MTTHRLALATCSGLPDLDPDDHALRDALAEAGVSVEPAVWDDPTIDWSQFDLVLIRSTWDYTERPTDFLAWTRRVEQVSRLLNPADVVAWNVDKRYLRALEGAGIPIVPTIWLDPARNLDARAVHTRFPAFGDFVIKPTVSAGSRDTGRYDAGQTPSRSLAIRHAKSLLAAGRHVMLQRYLEQVDQAGETALVYLDGELSHAARKAPLLEGPYRDANATGLYLEEELESREPSDAERELGDKVIAALPALLGGSTEGSEGSEGSEAGERTAEPLLYARVDLIPDADGNPVVLELELTEPSLFLAHGEGSVDRLVRAVLARLG